MGSPNASSTPRPDDPTSDLDETITYGSSECPPGNYTKREKCVPFCGHGFKYYIVFKVCLCYVHYSYTVIFLVYLVNVYMLNNNNNKIQ